MKKIIFLTNKPSILKHWQDALEGSYKNIHLETIQKVKQYLETEIYTDIIMVDELSVIDISKTLEMLQLYPNLIVLLFNSSPDVYHASRLLKNNVKGYENSYLNKINLHSMLKSVQNGKKWLFPDLTHYIINKYIENSLQKEPYFMPLLTVKEKKIALMIADGLSNKEIAQSDNIALSTVKNHIKNIFEKANVSDRISLALKFRLK